MTNWKTRPQLQDGVSAIGIWKAIYAAPDGNREQARLLIAADGFHFKMSDFDDLKLPSIALLSPNNTDYAISFDDDGKLLINGVQYVPPTSDNDEKIKGNKEFQGMTRLSGGLQMRSENGELFNIIIDDSGSLTTIKSDKEANDGYKNKSVE